MDKKASPTKSNGRKRHTSSVSLTSRKFFPSTTAKFHTTTTNQSHLFEPTKSHRHSKVMDFRPKRTLEEFSMDRYPLEVIDQRDRHHAIMESLEAQKRFSVSRYKQEEEEWLKEAEDNEYQKFKENKIKFLKIKYKHHFVELSKQNRAEHIKNNSWRISKSKKPLRTKNLKSIF